MDFIITLGLNMKQKKLCITVSSMYHSMVKELYCGNYEVYNIHCTNMTLMLQAISQEEIDNVVREWRHCGANQFACHYSWIFPPQFKLSQNIIPVLVSKIWQAIHCQKILNDFLLEDLAFLHYLKKLWQPIDFLWQQEMTFNLESVCGYFKGMI